MEFGEEFYSKLFRLLASSRPEATAEIRKMHQETMDYYESQGWIDHAACDSYVKKIKLAAEESALRRQARKDAARLKSEEAKTSGIAKKLSVPGSSPKRSSVSTSPSASPRRSTSVDKTGDGIASKKSTQAKQTIREEDIKQEVGIKQEGGGASVPPPGSTSPAAVKRTKSIAANTPSFEQAIGGYESDPGLGKKEIKKEKAVDGGYEKRKTEKRKLSDDERPMVKLEPDLPPVASLPVIIPLKKKVIPVAKLANAGVTVIGGGGPIPAVIKISSPAAVQEEATKPTAAFLSIAANISITAGGALAVTASADGLPPAASSSPAATSATAASGGSHRQTAVMIDSPPVELPAEFIEIRSSSPAAASSEDSTAVAAAFDDGPDGFELSCVVCKKQSGRLENKLLECQECHQGFHQKCHDPPVTSKMDARDVWYCQVCSKKLKKLSAGKFSGSSAGGSSGSGKSAGGASKQRGDGKTAGIKAEPASSSDSGANSGKSCVEMKAGISLLAADFIAKHKSKKVSSSGASPASSAKGDSSSSSKFAPSSPFSSPSSTSSNVGTALGSPSYGKEPKSGPGSLVAKGGAALAAAASARLASSHPLIPLTTTTTPTSAPPPTATPAGSSTRSDTLNRLKAGMGSASALSACINRPPTKLIPPLPMPPGHSSTMRIPMASADKRLQQMKKKAATKKVDRAAMK